ncbi:MAG TPA: branched-chain amino acid transaminase [Candidatus Paceibacterota bacterium]|nr:branched-chain amino acid transaminase [Candidatus Paceibacterota bacterium]
MKNIGVIWYDGKLVSFARARVHLLSHALHYGSSVYEGIRAYDTPHGPAIFRLHDHVDRLFRSAAALSIKVPYSEHAIEDAIIKTVAANKLRECYIRPLIFYGEGQMTLFPRGAKVHIAVAAWPWGAYLGGSKVLSTCLSPYIRFHPRSIAPGAKIGGYYATSVMATIDARRRGFDECIMLDHEGYLAEGPGENIFVAKHGKLFTPRSPSILSGITRASVVQIARDLGIPVATRKISAAELRSADEAFFTGTAAEVAAIGKVDGKKIGDGGLGRITQRVRSAYLEAVHGRLPRYKKWLAPAVL